jgi:hypothetical protein
VLKIPLIPVYQRLANYSVLVLHFCRAAFPAVRKIHNRSGPLTASVIKQVLEAFYFLDDMSMECSGY